MPKYILFLAQLKGEGRPFWNGKAENYPLNHLLYVEVMLTIMKVFIILFLLVRIGNILPIFKMSSYILFLVKLKGRGRSFLKGARRGTTLWDYPQEHLVVIRDEKISPFAKFEIRLSLFCFLLDPLTNKHWWTWTSMINLWIDCSTCQK